MTATTDTDIDVMMVNGAVATNRPEGYRTNAAVETETRADLLPMTATGLAMRTKGQRSRPRIAQERASRGTNSATGDRGYIFIYICIEIRSSIGFATILGRGMDIINIVYWQVMEIFAGENTLDPQLIMEHMKPLPIVFGPSTPRTSPTTWAMGRRMTLVLPPQSGLGEWALGRRRAAGLIDVQATAVGDLKVVNKHLHRPTARRQIASAPVEAFLWPPRPGRLPGTNSSSNCGGRARGRGTYRFWRKKPHRIANRRRLNRSPEDHSVKKAVLEKLHGALESSLEEPTVPSAFPSAGDIFKIESSTQALIVT